MATSVNKAILIGNLGRDPKLNHTDSGRPVLNLSVATNRKWAPKGEDGKPDWDNPREETDWHDVVVWGRRGESLADFLSKGDRVRIEGRMEKVEYTASDGTKNRVSQIVAGSRDEDIILLGSVGRGPREENASDEPAAGPGKQFKADDQLPF